MEEIKVGDYIRTKHGGIKRIEKIDFERYELAHKKGVMTFEDLEEMEDYIKNDITKHSPNIKELIEEGDVIEYIPNKDIDNLVYFCVVNKEGEKVLKTDETKEITILSVVTKEQYEAIKYVIGE